MTRSTQTEAALFFLTALKIFKLVHWFFLFNLPHKTSGIPHSLSFQAPVMESPPNNKNCSPV